MHVHVHVHVHVIDRPCYDCRMLRLAYLAIVATDVCAGCGSKPDKPPPPVAVLPHDAGIDGITSIPPFDPMSSMHLDDVTVHRPPPAARGKASHEIALTLRSTPSGAIARVDGVEVGPTPTFWSGAFDGQPHDFTFTLDHYATQEYRFVPVTSGVVHARLDRVASDEVDAGVPAAMLRQPPPVAPPIDAAVIVPTPPPPPPPVTIDAGATGLGPPPFSPASRVAPPSGTSMLRAWSRPTRAPLRGSSQSNTSAGRLRATSRSTQPIALRMKNSFSSSIASA